MLQIILNYIKNNLIMRQLYYIYFGLITNVMLQKDNCIKYVTD